MRAVTGRVPDYQKLELTAAQEAKASLAWPAPADAADAIDDFEHDLAVLRRLMLSGDDVKGRAHYMLTLNASPEAIGHRTLGACAKGVVAIRRPRPSDRCDAAVPPEAAAERAAVFGVRAAAVRGVSVSIFSFGGVSSLAAGRARAAAADGPADQGQPFSPGSGRVFPRLAEGEALHRRPAREIGSSRRSTARLRASPRNITSASRRRSIASGRTKSRACAPICACGSISLRRTPNGSRGCSSLRSVCPVSPDTIQKASRIR